MRAAVCSHLVCGDPSFELSHSVLRTSKFRHVCRQLHELHVYAMAPHGVDGSEAFIRKRSPGIKIESGRLMGSARLAQGQLGSSRGQGPQSSIA